MLDESEVTKVALTYVLGITTKINANKIINKNIRIKKKATKNPILKKRFILKYLLPGAGKSAIGFSV